MIDKKQLFEQLDFMAQMVPAAFYWIDLSGRFIGLNNLVLDAIGAPNKEYVIGKTLHELYQSKDIADALQNDIDEVIRTGNSSHLEDRIVDVTTGKVRYYMATRSPIWDYDGNIMGVVGTSIEITAEKEAEELRIENERHRLENERQRIAALEQERFKKDVDQVVHDIRSPLTSLDMLAKYCTSLPEADRNSFRHIATSISDIANNLLSKYSLKQPKDHNSVGHEDERQPLLVSTLLLQLLSDKKFQFKQEPVKFEANLNQDSYFAFVNAQPTSLTRALSNIINNAVEALEGNDGKVMLKLETTVDAIKIMVSDTGSGMSPELINKILNDEVVTEGKEDGHGIGLTQVREALQRNSGKLEIESIIGNGTSVSIAFARVEPPQWVATEIVLNSDDIVIVLDDDDSIHFAWDVRIEPLKVKHPDMQTHHFKFGQEVLDFIGKLSEQEKQKVFLLSDYELLQQNRTGLEIIKESKVKRSILVTSHYNNFEVRQKAASINTKILPKQLATDVLIKINRVEDVTEQPQKNTIAQNGDLKQVDLILLDDDTLLVDSLLQYMFMDMVVDAYYKPEDLLDKISMYHKDTKIALDNNYKNSDMKGIELAQKLHGMGFINLYILSGESLADADCMSYVTMILKADLDNIEKYLRNK